MNEELQIKELEQKVEALLSTEPAFFLVELRIKPIHNIKVFIDGDHGISIERLVSYNRQLYKQIEESGMFPNDDFSLEVSSPGVDEPLKLFRQYTKNIGREVEVTEKDGARKTGKLMSATDNEIVIEEVINKPVHARWNEAGGKNKKVEPVKHIISIDNIKSTRVQARF